MKQVWKFPVATMDTEIVVPRGAKILHLEVQHGDPCFWALVDPAAKPLERKVITYGTGHDVPADIDKTHDFIGTILVSGGALVWHLWISKES